MPSSSGKPRFLIGNGERLTESAKFISAPKPEKTPPYTVTEAAARLAPRLSRTMRSVSSLPPMARPRDEAVALVTLHPEFLAKTQFPATLFAGIGLRALGSRARRISPEKWTPQHKPVTHEPETIELYVAGSTKSFGTWSDLLKLGSDYFRGAEELARIEDVRPLESLDRQSRVRIPPSSAETILLEASIHLPDDEAEPVWDAFRNYAASLGVRIIEEVGVATSGLAFAPV